MGTGMSVHTLPTPVFGQILQKVGDRASLLNLLAVALLSYRQDFLDEVILHLRPLLMGLDPGFTRTDREKFFQSLIRRQSRVAGLRGSWGGSWETVDLSKKTALFPRQWRLDTEDCRRCWGLNANVISDADYADLDSAMMSFILNAPSLVQVDACCWRPSPRSYQLLLALPLTSLCLPTAIGMGTCDLVALLRLPLKTLWLKDLGNSPRLQQSDLLRVFLDTPPLTSVTRMRLSGALITGEMVVAAARFLPNLDSLDVSRCPGVSAEALAVGLLHMPNLSSLYCDASVVSDLQQSTIEIHSVL